MKGLVGSFLQVNLLKVMLLAVGIGEVSLLEIDASGGYVFTGLCLAVFQRLCGSTHTMH